MVLAAFCALMLYAGSGLPDRGSVHAPHQRENGVYGRQTASSYYLRNSMWDAKTPNVVTAVLGDYRSFDTLGEVVVVLTAGLCCFMIMRKERQ
jgi:multicomponent Na+:H+ antiporter subunit B